MVKSVLKMSAALAVMAFPLSANAITLEDISGNWSCVVQAYDLSAFGEYEYDINPSGMGRITGYFDIYQDEGTIAVDFMSDMALRIDGETLYEGATAVDVESMTVGDQDVGDEMKDALAADMVAQGESPNSIKYYDQNVLLLASGDNASFCVKE